MSQRLQDKIRKLEADNQKLVEDLEAARRDATRGREMVCDWLAQRVFGTPIFGSAAPALAPDQLEQEAYASIKKRARTGRDVAKDMTEKFYAEFDARSKGASQ